MTLRAGSQPPSQMAAQARLLALWTRWLYNELIIPMIRAHFYCTESEAYRQQVLYFRLALCTAVYRLKLSCNKLCTSDLHFILHALIPLCACLRLSVSNTVLCLCQVVTYRGQSVLHILPMSLAHIRSTVDIQLAYATATTQAVYLGPGSCRSPMHASSCKSCTSLLCRKPVWAKLKNTAYEGLTGKMYTPLPATAAQACLQARSLGVAKLRLLPKKTGQPRVELGALRLSLYHLCPCLKHTHSTQHTH